MLQNIQVAIAIAIEYTDIAGSSTEHKAPAWSTSYHCAAGAAAGYCEGMNSSPHPQPTVCAGVLVCVRLDQCAIHTAVSLVETNVLYIQQ